MSKKITVFGLSFWDLWWQKMFRNIASMKYQWLLFLYIPVIWGMLHTIPGTTPPMQWIPPTVGLGFLGGGFVTLALARIVARTKLTENGNGNEESAEGPGGPLDTDR
jgi:hypothetical protein